MLSLKELRQATHLSQDKFAQKYHLSASTLRRWEQGTNEPPEWYVFALNELFARDGIVSLPDVSVDASNSVSVSACSGDPHMSLASSKPSVSLEAVGNFTKFVKYYQFGVFYERELKLWHENKDFRGKPLHDYLYENRLKYIGKKPEELTDAEILRGLTISGVLKSYTRFDASLMKEVIQKYAIKSVYDPCAGWGERMLCAYSERIPYKGVDINEKLRAGYENMICDLGLDDCIFSVGDSSVLRADDGYDAVITCPPYYDVEHYSDIGAENLSYSDFLNWWDNVVTNSVTNSTRYFCFQINCKYRDDMIRIVEDHDFCLIDAMTYKTNNSSHFTRRKGGKNVKKEFETMLVFARL